MRIATRMPRTGDERGNVILEVAIVIPFVLLLLIGTIEFSALLRIRETLTMISREAANESFRRCAADTSFGQCANVLSGVDACLLELRQKMQTLGSAVLGSLDVTISVYVYEPDTDAIVLIGITKDPVTGTATPTKFDDIRVRNELYTLIQTQEVLTISEVSFNYAPVLPGLSWFPSMNFYNVTMF